VISVSAVTQICSSHPLTPTKRKRKTETVAADPTHAHTAQSYTGVAHPMLNLHLHLKFLELLKKKSNKLNKTSKKTCKIV